MAEHLIERLIHPVAAQVRGWFKTRAMRAELHALPAAERGSVLRELGYTDANIDKMVADHPGPNDFLPKRLHGVGIDAEGLERTQPGTVRDLQRVCSMCPDWKSCSSDIERADAVERLNTYCPNTHTIESLIAGQEEVEMPSARECCCGKCD